MWENIYIKVYFFFRCLLRTKTLSKICKHYEIPIAQSVTQYEKEKNCLVNKASVIWVTPKHIINAQIIDFKEREKIIKVTIIKSIANSFRNRTDFQILKQNHRVPPENLYIMP